MKKKFVSLLAFCALTALTASAQNVIVVGDMNGDDVLSADDVTLLADAVQLKSSIIPSAALLSGDMNGDGVLSVADVAHLSDYVRGFVNLGLPSGTLWATCNVGANTPEDYGDYFAWGKTNKNDWYKEFNNLDEIAKKYTAQGTELVIEYDVAYVNWGKDWRMPSIEQFQELFLTDYVTTEWVRQNGKNGRLITSKSNGASIFLPAAGYTDPYNAGNYGYYWSRSLDTRFYGSAYAPDFGSDEVDTSGGHWMYSKFPVRPVRVSSQN